MASFPFLTARWSHLVNFTYAVPPELLLKHVPSGTVLDVQDGHAFVSLVAFDFLNTKVFGIPWPGYRDFPELNLRFYVKKNDERGVVFIREFVPKALIAKLAKLFYNEPYEAAPMYSRVVDDGQSVSYELGVEAQGHQHRVKIQGLYPTFMASEDSEAHYFKEHKWGFGRTRSGKTLTYEVEHPWWETYHVDNWELDVDFGALYGKEWAFLKDTEPLHVIFAVGSDIKVFPQQIFRP